MRLDFTGRSRWISLPVGWQHEVVILYWCVLLFYVSCATNSFSLQFAGLRRIEVDRQGVVRRVAARPRAKRFFPEPLSEGEVLVLGLHSLWRMSPLFFQKGIQARDDIQRWVDVSVTRWHSPIDISVKISMASCIRRISQMAIISPPSTPNYAMLVDIFGLLL